MAYSGRFTISAAISGPLAQDCDPLLLRVDSGPAIPIFDLDGHRDHLPHEA